MHIYLFMYDFFYSYLFNFLSTIFFFCIRHIIIIIIYFFSFSRIIFIFLYLIVKIINKTLVKSLPIWKSFNNWCLFFRIPGALVE